MKLGKIFICINILVLSLYYKEIDNSITNTTIHACESIEARTPQYYIRRS